MSSYSLVPILLVVCLFNFAYADCPTNWTVFNRDCCSSTFGLNSTVPTYHVIGPLYPDDFIVWNDSSHSSLGIDTDWTTLNIHWGQLTGNKTGPYIPNGLIDIVKIFYQPNKGLYGLQFHDSLGFSPILGMATRTYVDLNLDGRPFTGWGVITSQTELLQSLGVCFRML